MIDAGPIDRIRDGIVVVDGDWRCRFVNRAAAEIAGRLADAMVGRVLWDAWPGSGGGRMEERLRHALATQETVEFEEPLSRPDHWYAVRAVPAPDGLTLTLQETSAQRAADLALETLLTQLYRHRRLATLLAETNEVVFRARSPQELFDGAVRVAVEHGGFLLAWIGAPEPSSGRIRSLAAAGIGARDYVHTVPISVEDDRLGQGPGGLALRTGRDAYVNDVRTDPRMEPWRKAAARVGYRSCGAFPFLVDGRVRGALAVYSAEPRYFDEDEIALVRRLAANIGHGWEALEHEQALRDAEVEREQADRLESLGKLAGGVAHDFNNVLGVILNYTSLLERQALPAPVRSDLAEVRSAANRASALIRQLLTFARRDQAHPEPVDLNDAIRDVASLLDRTIGPAIDLSLRLTDEPLVSVIDRNQLDQVILNLALNARDAMPEGGVVTITTDGRPSNVLEAVVQVSDTGTGMPPDVAARAFEPFFTTKPPGQGTGLGLATAYGIVHRAGGSLSINSAVGSGTTVSMRLPLAVAGDPSPRAEEAVPRPVTGRGEQVLVVEDDPQLRDATRRIVEGAGYRALVAGDGEQALEVLAAHHGVDLVLSDMVMPRMGGEELARRLSRRLPPVPVVLMTGYDPGDTHPLGEVLLKPVDEDRLLVALRHALGG